MIGIPFPGSKRYSYKYVKEIAENADYLKAFEPFGGSCILTANLYNDELIETGYINDYDRLFDIYPEFLDVKDKLVQRLYDRGLRKIVHPHKSNGPIQRLELDGTRTTVDSVILPDHEVKILQEEIAKIDKKYWLLLAFGANFTFSAVSMHKKVMLHDFKYFRADLETKNQREYLRVINELERTSVDYRQFFEMYADKFDENSLLIVDPPYIGTYQYAYKNDDEFAYDDTLELMKLCSYAGCDFVFFNNNPRQVERLFEETRIQPEYIKRVGNSSSTCNRNRYDVMAFVKGWK